MAGKLTAPRAATAKPGRYGDGGGLWLAVAASGAKKWAFRFSHGGKVTEMGLGSAGTVSLSEARDLALAARKTVSEGKNPIEVRREAKRAKAGQPTFAQMAAALIEARTPGWKNEKNKYQWRHITFQSMRRTQKSLGANKSRACARLDIVSSGR